METISENTAAGHRCGYVALVGKPNAGKSTLLNALLGEKLSIVTNKPQTTRHRVVGIYNDEAMQIVFLDTPGVIEPRYRLQERMMGSVRSALVDADLIVMLADATTGTVDALTLETLPPDIPKVLVLNKMDLVETELALPLTQSYIEKSHFEAVFPISALNQQGLDKLVEGLQERLPVAPPFFPKDQLSEHPERFFVSEIIREQIFKQYQAEIPYSVQVNVIQYVEQQGRKDHISVDIVVLRASQKGILIGKGGAALKKLGQASRYAIEQFLDRPVFLELFVKVRDGWRDQDTYLNEYGY
jgi:GTP-binding protein Era